MNGNARIGIDDFARKIIGKIDAVELPPPNKDIKKGEPLFSITTNSHAIKIASPLSGKVTLVNAEHIEHPEWIASKPFELSWMCCLEPSNLAEELPSLKIGVDSIKWYRGEIDKYSELKRVEKDTSGAGSADERNDRLEGQQTDKKFLGEFANTFLLS
jgi:glycine cleavage system H lipoate-binding protein